MPKIKKGDPRPPGAGKKAKAPEDRALTPRMKRLADFYLVPGTSIIDAAIKAGYPKASAGAQGSWALAQPSVAKYVAARQAKLQEKHDVTLDRVIREFAKIGFANMDDYLVDDGNGRPQFRLMGEIGRDKLAVVTEVTVDVRKEFEGRGEDREQVATIDRIRFKLADKVNALTQLGKHLGMFPKESRADEDDITVSGVGSRNITIKVKGGLPQPKEKK